MMRNSNFQTKHLPLLLRYFAAKEPALTWTFCWGCSCCCC